MELRRTRPYLPWWKGKAERGNREDGNILYVRKAFTNKKDLRKQATKHETRYNKTVKAALDFKSSNQVVSDIGILLKA